MEFKGVCVLVCVLLLVDCSLQQSPMKKKPLKKDDAIEDLQKQMDDIKWELNLIKEQQALQTVCLKGTKILRKCYLADPLMKRYHNASEDCMALGGVLGTPTSSDENDQLREYIRQNIGSDTEVWLGANEMMKKGVWTDQSGQTLTYRNWDTSSFQSPQPDDGQSQNCAVLSVASRGKWFHEKCSEERPSVCQFNIV